MRDFLLEAGLIYRAMAIVIKEIIVRTTVEKQREEVKEAGIPEELVARLKESILRELEKVRIREPGKRER